MYNLKDLPNFKISRSIEKKIQEVVLSNLGLDSINKLRDKFEGVAFYNRIRDQIYSIIAIESFFNVKILNWESLEKDSLETLQTVLINGKGVRLINSRVGEPFFIPKELKEEYMIFIYTTNSEYVYIAGYLECKPENMYKTLMNKNISPIKLRSFQGSIDNVSVLSDINKLTS